MEALFSSLERAGVSRVLAVADRPSGLRAVIAIDDTTLGPAAGGVRTMRYATANDGLADALSLARAMTIKCALAGLDAGGAKAVVLDHEGLDRRQAFLKLGRVIEELGGLFRTAGDLGTTGADLEVMASVCRYVHTDERGLSKAVARGLLACIQACVELRGSSIHGQRVVVQGAGSIGAAVAETLVNAGAKVFLADVREERARALAERLGPAVTVIDARDALSFPADILAPCAIGGVITSDLARSTSAWAICGAANNALVSAEVARILADRGIQHVPDPIASAGAVIDGIGASVMGLSDRSALIDKLGATTKEVLTRAVAEHKTPVEVAEALAYERIKKAATLP